MALAKGRAPQEVAEQVRTIREDLEEEAKKDGGFKNEEEAVQFVRNEARARGWLVPDANAPLGGVRLSVTEPKEKEAQTPPDLRVEQGIWMPPALREQAGEVAAEFGDKNAPAEGVWGAIFRFLLSAIIFLGILYVIITLLKK